MTCKAAKVAAVDSRAWSVRWMDWRQRWIGETVVVRFVLRTRCATIELRSSTTLFLTESLTLTRSKETFKRGNVSKFNKAVECSHC